MSERVRGRLNNNNNKYTRTATTERENERKIDENKTNDRKYFGETTARENNTKK